MYIYMNIYIYIYVCIHTYEGLVMKEDHLERIMKAADTDGDGHLNPDGKIQTALPCC